VISSTEGIYGDWRKFEECSDTSGIIVGFKLRSEPKQGGDVMMTLLLMILASTVFLLVEKS